MRLAEAEVNKEYKLKPLTSSINPMFINATVKFITKPYPYATIAYRIVTGDQGSTSIHLEDKNWEIVPIEEDWDN